MYIVLHARTQPIIANAALYWTASTLLVKRELAGIAWAKMCHLADKLPTGQTLIKLSISDGGCVVKSDRAQRQQQQHNQRNRSFRTTTTAS